MHVKKLSFQIQLLPINQIFPNQAAANQATMTAMLSINNGKGSTRSAKSANPQHSIK
jgi:hypothetical protein